MTTLPLSPVPDEPIAAVRTGVLTALGRPPGLYRVAVIPLWLTYYRVNVLVGPDPATVAIPHSYFIEADAAGRILTAVPPLTRMYS